MGVFARRSIEQSVTFQADPPVGGEIDSVKYMGYEDGRVFIILVAKLHFDGFLTVKDNQLFGMTPGSMAPDTTGYEFYSHHPVEFELLLKPEIWQALPDAADPEQLLQQISDALARDDDPHGLRQADSYLYLGAYQQSLEASNYAVQTGFRSRYPGPGRS